MSRACRQCPRKCNIDRTETVGFCGMPQELRVARVALHPWEEPILCRGKGSGTVFFCGCSLRCVFCQNRDISHGGTAGRAVSPEELGELFLKLQEMGACNINLVTPSHYAEALVPILRAVRPRLQIPVIYNCGGYESVEALRALEGLIDIYLPDAKYFDPMLSARYSAAPDYYRVLRLALREMLRQVGELQYGKEGELLRGVLVRHLVLPGCRRDSIALLEALAEEFGSSAFLLSLMSQYTPDFADPAADKSLHRRLTEFEYRSVLETVDRLGFSGFMQGRASSNADYTPSFSEKSLL